ncbi:MAG TPA: SPOR domain-containing protein [Terracidiphilus sp.]|jgi:cell division septation protein DedD
MHRGFGGTVFEPVEQRQDKEITLGPAVLIALGCGLFALCGLCFVCGYGVGHRNSETSVISASLPTAGIPAIAAPAGGTKPSAGQSGSQKAPEPADGSVASVDEAAAQTDSTPASTAATAAAQAPLPPQPVAAQPVAGNSAGVTTAIPQAQALMVQIAAVSHPEDADVLVGALRKRGYAVTAHRDPMDGLLHVQVGPFANRNDAFAMRQKLLNDGYNAIVQ